MAWWCKTKALYVTMDENMWTANFEALVKLYCNCIIIYNSKVKIISLELFKMILSCGASLYSSSYWWLQVYTSYVIQHTLSTVFINYHFSFKRALCYGNNMLAKFGRKFSTDGMTAYLFATGTDCMTGYF